MNAAAKELGYVDQPSAVSQELLDARTHSMDMSREEWRKNGGDQHDRRVALRVGRSATYVPR